MAIRAVVSEKFPCNFLISSRMHNHWVCASRAAVAENNILTPFVVTVTDRRRE